MDEPLIPYTLPIAGRTEVDGRPATVYDGAGLALLLTVTAEGVIDLHCRVSRQDAVDTLRFVAEELEQGKRPVPDEA